MQIWTNYRSSCSQVTKWLFYRFWKILKKATTVESYFNTVTGLVVLLTQDPTTCVFVKTSQNFQNKYFLQGVCISRPPALCLAPSPGPQFVFTGPGPHLVFTDPGPQFVFTGPGPHLVFTPNLYLPAQLDAWVCIYRPCLPTGPGLRFVRTQAAKLICPQWCWLI